MKPPLLFVSPVFPALTGSGRGMRAGMFLRALAARYRVSLLVIPLGDAGRQPMSEALAALCDRQEVVSLSRSADSRPAQPTRPLGLQGPAQPGVWWRATPERVEAAARAFRGVEFEIVHVFRLYTVPFAVPYLTGEGRRAPRPHLDLDDVESTTRRSLANLLKLRGFDQQVALDALQAERYQTLERALLPRFERVYVCSEADRAALERRSCCREVRVVPNAVSVPPPPPPPPPGDPFTFLFVGTLGYLPNEDALLFLFDEVLPLLRRRTSRPFRVAIVGGGASRSIQDLGRRPEALLVGPVADLAPWYASAHAVIVPIRAGGGTRIKALEAFSYRRPVVSTSIGIEGIDARDGEHVLIGDSAEAFAEACARLMADSDLAAGLAERAFALLTRSYTLEVVTRTVAALD